MPAPLCVYCQAADGTTRDHVPPKGLFPEPRPSNLVTVPCCDICRNGQSGDDEYFIRMLVMQYDLGGSAPIQALLPKVTRSLGRPEQAGFNRSLFQSINQYDLTSEAGLLIGAARTYSVERERLSRVVTRVTVGLFSHEFGRSLPTHCYRGTFPLYGTENARQDTQEKLANLLALVQCAPEKAVHRDVHFYHVQRFKDDPCKSLWLHVFFTRAAFLSVTSQVPPGFGRAAG